MYKKLHSIASNHFNRRISEPGDLDLLQNIVSNLSGLNAYIKVIGPSKAYPGFMEGKEITIKKADYAGRTVKIQANEARINFPCMGLIITRQEIGLSLFFPDSEEPGVNLIILVTG